VEATSLTDGATYYGTSDVDGTYTVSGLLGDSYSVCAYPTGGGVTGFLSRCYQDQPPGSALIDAVVVLDGATTNQTDIQLPVAAEIRGTVTDSGTGSPVAGVEVDAFPTGSRGAQMTVSTAADGTYSMAGLEDGDYLVCFFPDLGFAPQCYSNQPADGTGSPQPVPALAGASSTGIDAALTPGN
jgi:hypothetical protein